MSSASRLLHHRRLASSSKRSSGCRVSFGMSQLFSNSLTCSSAPGATWPADAGRPAGSLAVTIKAVYRLQVVSACHWCLLGIVKVQKTAQASVEGQSHDRDGDDPRRRQARR